MSGLERSLVVIADSMTYWNQSGEQPLDHPDSMAMRMAVHLSVQTGEQWRAVNLSHGGRTAFDARKLLRTDAETRRLVAQADAVVFGAFAKDGVVSPFPRSVRLLIGRIPKRYRRRVVHFLRPRVARLTSRMFPWTPPRLFKRSFFEAVELIRQLNPEATLIGISPCAEYGPQTIVTFPDDWLAPDGHHALSLRYAAQAGLPCMDLVRFQDEHAGPWMDDPDYLHWPEHVHDLAALEATDLLLAVRGVVPARVRVPA